MRYEKCRVRRLARAAAVLAGALFALASTISAADDAFLESLPPVVLKTFPVSGYDKVDPDTTEIKFFFNKKMTDKSWSFVQLDKKSFPELVGSPFFDARLHVCTLKVRLKPATTYVIWLNKGRFQNFKDASGRAAVPYLLAFRTAGEAFMRKKRAAVAAAEAWLALLDSARFAETWKTADDFFKSRVSERKWTAQIKMISGRLGKLDSRKFIGAVLKDGAPQLPGCELFVLRYSTSYKNKPRSIETVVPILGTDGKWRVSGYFIK